MEKGWTLILSVSGLEAKLRSAVLEANGIRVIVIDKEDSSYPVGLGQAEIYVRQEDVIHAKRIIDEEDA